MEEEFKGFNDWERELSRDIPVEGFGGFNDYGLSCPDQFGYYSTWP